MQLGWHRKTLHLLRRRFTNTNPACSLVLILMMVNQNNSPLIKNIRFKTSYIIKIAIA